MSKLDEEMIDKMIAQKKRIILCLKDGTSHELPYDFNIDDYDYTGFESFGVLHITEMKRKLKFADVDIEKLYCK